MENKIQTYGKLNPIRKMILDFRSVFKVNEKARAFLQKRGMDAYVPKPKKRFYVAAGTSIILCTPLIPVGVVGVPIVMGWGLK